jgi:hypothetical protein
MWTLAMFEKRRKPLRWLITRYIKGSQPVKEPGIVDPSTQHDDRTSDDVKNFDLIRTVTINQPLVEPSPLVRQRIMTLIHESDIVIAPRYRVEWNVIAGSFLTLIILVLLWLTARPGMALQWSLEHDGISIFRIYRAAQGSNQFELLKEIPAQTNQLQYRFVDSILIPGKDYRYRVEGVRSNGVSTFSQVVDGSFLDLLPGQLALLLSSIIVSVEIMLIMHRWPLHSAEKR